MSKPFLDSFEAVALKNRLDMLVAQIRIAPRESRSCYVEQIRPLAARYQILTNTPYKYADAWTREID